MLTKSFWDKFNYGPKNASSVKETKLMFLDALKTTSGHQDCCFFSLSWTFLRSFQHHKINNFVTFLIPNYSAKKKKQKKYQNVLLLILKSHEKAIQKHQSVEKHLKSNKNVENAKQQKNVKASKHPHPPY